MKVGQRIRQIREQRGLSEVELGQLVSVAGATISRYEQGLRKVDADRLPRFAEALRVSPCDFFEPGEGPDSFEEDPADQTEPYSATTQERIVRAYLRRRLGDEDARLVEAMISALERKRN